MRYIALIAALHLGCSSSKDPAPRIGKAPAVMPKSAATAPPVNRWLRAPASEPDPAAKGLYRQATRAVHDGQLALAEPLFKQIRSQYPQSRFARRLATDGFPVVEAAQLATVVVVFGVGALMLGGGR